MATYIVDTTNIKADGFNQINKIMNDASIRNKKECIIKVCEAVSCAVSCVEDYGNPLFEKSLIEDMDNDEEVAMVSEIESIEF